MVAAFYAELELAVSADRLAPFQLATGNQLEAAVNYFWNIALCQTLYPSLNMLEVATRNSLHAFLSARFNREDWYDEPNFLQRRELDDIYHAKRSVRRTHNLYTPGHIIAALNFGFWVSLLDSLYGENPGGPQIWGAFPSPNLSIVFSLCSGEPSVLSTTHTWAVRRYATSTQSNLSLRTDLAGNKVAISAPQDTSADRVATRPSRRAHRDNWLDQSNHAGHHGFL